LSSGGEGSGWRSRANLSEEDRLVADAEARLAESPVGAIKEMLAKSLEGFVGRYNSAPMIDAMRETVRRQLDDLVAQEMIVDYDLEGLALAPKGQIRAKIRLPSQQFIRLDFQVNP
jgi:hypothetical protein